MGKLNVLFRYAGFYPMQLVNNIKGLRYWRTNRKAIKSQMTERGNKDFTLTVRPQLGDRFDTAGTMVGHYFHQDLLVAQKIHDANPIEHVDIGSRIDGFVAHLASFRKVKVFDIRPVESKVENIAFEQRDIMEFYADLEGRCESISCLHAIEHFGLGRYGDPVDVDGHTKALDNIYRYLKSGGVFYFAVPIGEHQRIEFDAHRVFSVGYLMNLFEDKYELLNFSYVDDAGDLHKNIVLNNENKCNSFGLNYGCGIFELKKKG